MSSTLTDTTQTQSKTKTNISDLFQDAKYRKSYVKICAPMVRYSKLQFRTLARKYGADLCFTPMIMADSFCRSSKARNIEFSTNSGDTPVIAQFAAKSSIDYLSAAEMVYPYVDGIDLNCGCPQRWAIATGYGCALLNDPELIHDLTSSIKRNLSSDFSVSVKIRLQKPLTKTVNLCRQLEKCGITFITVHGRTATQKNSEPSNEAYLQQIKDSIGIPFVANGDVKCLDDANSLHKRINCDGVMAGRAILSNPALFRGDVVTPLECIQDWLNITHATGDDITFQCFHHHLTFMMDKLMQRRARIEFNNYTRKGQVYDFLEKYYQIVPQSLEHDDPMILCEYDEENHANRLKRIRAEEIQSTYNSEMTLGKYYLNHIDDQNSENSNKLICDCGLDYMETSLFDTNDEMQ